MANIFKEILDTFIHKALKYISIQLLGNIKFI